MDQFIHFFNLFPHCSYAFLKRIRFTFGDFKTAWNGMNMKNLLKAGFKNELVEALVAHRKSIDMNGELDKLWKANVFVVERNSDEYPPLLKEIYNSPFLIYRKGAVLSDRQYVAIVGTRVPSNYGLECGYEIGKKICVNGGVTVSGLAFGIDAISHKAAIDEKKPTVAVLASSLNQITPRTHESLSRQILECGGTIISEYATDENFNKNRFVERNRIISGMCKTTIIIEAREKSGALITAKHAFEQNRDVYALVGDIFRSQAKGCLSLIQKDMAKPITEFDELMSEIGLVSRNEILDINCQMVLTALKNRRTLNMEKLIQQTGLDENTINVCLIKLDVMGLIKRRLM